MKTKGPTNEPEAKGDARRRAFTAGSGLDIKNVVPKMRPQSLAFLPLRPWRRPHKASFEAASRRPRTRKDEAGS